jgi:MFS family permease
LGSLFAKTLLPMLHFRHFSGSLKTEYRAFLRRYSSKLPPVEKKKLSEIDPKIIQHTAILTISQFIVNIGFGIVVPALPQFAAELGMGAFGVGVILSAPSIARLLLNSQMGHLADSIGRRPLMVWGSVVAALGGIGTAFASGYSTVVPARLLVGVGSAATVAGTAAAMADFTDPVPNHRGMSIVG